jgi:hypothetical protein
MYKCFLAVLISAMALAACGGGGGSPTVPTGASSSGTSGNGAVATSEGTLSLELRDAANAVTSTVLSSGTTARARLVDANNAVVANKLVTFTTADDVATISPLSGQVLTDSNGVASIQLTPASLTTAGAATLTATAVSGTTTLTKTLDYRVTPANVKLGEFNLGAATLPAYGNRTISVQVTADALPVATPVQVSFTASCGAANLAPSSVSTDTNGRASTTYSAIAPECFGRNLTITASVVGAAALSGQISIAAAQLANIQFVSSAPQLIYLTGSTGATQAIVTFKVIDSYGNPVQNQSVNLSLVNSKPGVSLNSSGNIDSVLGTTDSSGQVSTTVFAGTIPTSVQVKAIVPSDTSIPATLSNILTIASGRAVQKATSIALGQFAIEGADFDGITTTVTVSLADRQGNPVPDGTQVNLTSESGVLVPPTCIMAGGTSSCVVTIRSQGTRPVDGRVSILAYLPGEEDFIDVNANNIYDSGESFTDLGDAYRDDNEDGKYVSAEDFTVPRGRPGIACSAPIASAVAPDNTVGGANGRPDHCDGVWGVADVRRQIVVIFATSTAKIVSLQPKDPPPVDEELNISLRNLQVRISDLNGNGMPVKSTLEFSSITPGCSIATSISEIPNTPRFTDVPFTATGCAEKDNVTVKVTTPTGKVTSKAFTLSK